MQIMQRAASNIRTEANVLKDTVDGDGVAELAAQSAATKAIGDLSAHELRKNFVVRLGQVSAQLGAVDVALSHKQLDRGKDLAQEAHSTLLEIMREVRP